MQGSIARPTRKDVEYSGLITILFFPLLRPESKNNFPSLYRVWGHMESSLHDYLNVPNPTRSPVQKQLESKLEAGFYGSSLHISGKPVKGCRLSHSQVAGVKF